jgi:hypothetical protein
VVSSIVKDVYLKEQPHELRGELMAERIEREALRRIRSPRRLRKTNK